jgi:hypothetical protein
LKREDAKRGVALPDDGPRGPPIGASPNQGNDPIELIGKRKAALVALAGVLAGAAAAMVPRFLI